MKTVVGVGDFAYQTPSMCYTVLQYISLAPRIHFEAEETREEEEVRGDRGWRERYDVDLFGDGGL